MRSKSAAQPSAEQPFGVTGTSFRQFCFAHFRKAKVARNSKLELRSSSTTPNRKLVPPLSCEATIGPLLGPIILKIVTIFGSQICESRFRILLCPLLLLLALRASTLCVLEDGLAELLLGPERSKHGNSNLNFREAKASEAEV